MNNNRKFDWGKRLPALLLGILAGYGIGNAYEVPVHQEIAYDAYSRSIFATSDAWFHLGLEHTDPATVRLGPEERQYPADFLIALGAKLEDDLPRPINHFYDPVNNQPLGSGSRSIDWALAGEGEISGQELGYRQMRDDLYKALTGTHEEYTKGLASYFEGLGHVIHHIQDMAQPEHTRLDAHCGEWFCAIGSIVYPPLYDPSGYEGQTLDGIETLPYGGYPSSQLPRRKVSGTQPISRAWRISPTGIS